MLQQKVLRLRRLNSRVQTTDDVWAYWHCNGRTETSRLRDVSLGGVFLETPTPHSVGSTAQIHFLVREGQIRTEGVVRHLQPGRGLGFRFTAVKDGDRPRFVSFVNRVRGSPLSRAPEG
jgi:hypothetical protein